MALGKLVLPWLGLCLRLGCQHLCSGTAGCRGDRAASFRDRPGLGLVLDNGPVLTKPSSVAEPVPNLGTQGDPGTSASSLFCALAPSWHVPEGHAPGVGWFYINGSRLRVGSLTSSRFQDTCVSVLRRCFPSRPLCPLSLPEAVPVRV